LNFITKLLVLAWVGILAVIGGSYAGVGALAPAAAGLLAYSSFVSPVSIFGIASALWFLLDWKVSGARRRREEAAIIRDKPSLAKDKRALARERRVREKELGLQRKEERALRAENRAEKKLAKEGRRENKLERRREEIALKKEELRERESLGR
jgi:hypothetical protein